MTFSSPPQSSGVFNVKIFADADKTIRYLDGNELKNMKVNSCKVLFDINDGRSPYMVKTDNYNIYGNRIQTDVVVHLESLETQE